MPLFWRSPLFRLHIDEVGHHNMKSSSDPNERYLGLTGVIMQVGYADGEFTDTLNAVKSAVFGCADFSLHRREIVDRKPEPFTVLREENKRKQFDELILKIIEDAKYRVFTVVIDKREHKAKYTVWQYQPYHYCMAVLLERYVQWLKRVNVTGDVLAESRGKKENKQLSKAYRRIYAKGTERVPAKLFQSQLTSGEIKLKSKSGNVAALQLADLIASPSCRELVCRNTKQVMTAEFGKKVVDVLYRKKYLRSVYDGRVQGWGTKWLP
jgi:hypothetical protein